MTLLESLADKGASSVEKRAGPWIDQAVARGSLEVADRSDLVRLPALAALSVLKDNSQVLSSTSGKGFALIVSHLALGNEDAAVLVWIRDKATFDERMAALDAAHDAVRLDREQKSAAWDEVRRVALQVLAAAGKVALPLLLAAI